MIDLRENLSNQHSILAETMLGLIVLLSNAIHILIEIVQTESYLSIIIWFLILLTESKIY